MCNRRPQAPRIEFEMKNGLQLNSKYWEPFFHDGAALDLGHLEPIEFPCATPDKNTRLVRVIFSPHVFTRGACKDDQEAEICFDQRVYCPDRYAASLRLPEVMLDLPNAKVYQTWEKRNYLHMLTIDEDSEHTTFSSRSPRQEVSGIDIFFCGLKAPTRCRSLHTHRQLGRTQFDFQCSFRTFSYSAKSSSPRANPAVFKLANF